MNQSGQDYLMVGALTRQEFAERPSHMGLADRVFTLPPREDTTTPGSSDSYSSMPRVGSPDLERAEASINFNYTYGDFIPYKRRASTSPEDEPMAKYPRVDAAVEDMSVEPSLSLTPTVSRYNSAETISRSDSERSTSGSRAPMYKQGLLNQYHVAELLQSSLSSAAPQLSASPAMPPRGGCAVQVGGGGADGSLQDVALRYQYKTHEEDVENVPMTDETLVTTTSHDESPAPGELPFYMGDGLDYIYSPQVVSTHIPVDTPALPRETDTEAEEGDTRVLIGTCNDEDISDMCRAYFRQLDCHGVQLVSHSCVLSGKIFHYPAVPGRLTVVNVHSISAASWYQYIPTEERLLQVVRRDRGRWTSEVCAGAAIQFVDVPVRSQRFYDVLTPKHTVAVNDLIWRSTAGLNAATCCKHVEHATTAYKLPHIHGAPTHRSNSTPRGTKAKFVRLFRITCTIPLPVGGFGTVSTAPYAIVEKVPPPTSHFAKWVAQCRLE